MVENKVKERTPTPQFMVITLIKLNAIEDKCLRSMLRKEQFSGGKINDFESLLNSLKQCDFS